MIVSLHSGENSGQKAKTAKIFIQGRQKRGKSQPEPDCRQKRKERRAVNVFLEAGRRPPAHGSSGCRTRPAERANLSYSRDRRLRRRVGSLHEPVGASPF